MDLVKLFDEAARRAGCSVRTIRGIDKVPSGLLSNIIRQVKARRAKGARNGKRRAAHG